MEFSILRAKYQKLVVIAGTVILFDQITKAAIFNTLPLYRSVVVIPGFFNLAHIQNPGGAFGFLATQSSSVRILLFLLISSVAAGLIFYFYRNTPQTHPLLATGFALIFGGALGNLIDRIRFGRVIDFFDFYLGSYHWPAFNIADSAITVGVVIFLFHIVFNKLPE